MLPLPNCTVNEESQPATTRLPLPERVVAHGWWLRDAAKISKSQGGVVDPLPLIREFGIDPLRYFLMREMVCGQDANYSDEAFIDRSNNDLANDLGNLTSRSLNRLGRCLAPN